MLNEAKTEENKKNWGNLMWTFRYTHVEENSCMGVMESLVSMNAVAEAGGAIQKFAKHIVCCGQIVHWRLILIYGMGPSP